MLLQQIIRVPLSKVRSREPVRVGPDARLGDVVLRMNEARTGAALVIDPQSGKLTGIFTEHDLLRRVDLGTNAWRDQRVSSVMTSGPDVIGEDDSIAEALRRMEAGRYRHLPVVRGEDPVAVVSVRDLLAYLATVFPGHFINLPPDPDKEAHAPWGG